MTPLISVIIPTYQHARSLPGCIDSVLAQQDVQIEIIVVDDGSTDNTAEVLAVYGTQITVVQQNNQGANFARNRGLKEAQGKYVIFADADVIMKPRMLTTCLAALASAPDNVAYAYTGFRFGWKTFYGVPFSAEHLRRVNFAHTTSLVRRKDFPGFDEAVRRFQDWDVWLTMLAQGKYGVLVPGIWFHVRIDGTSRIGSSWLPTFVYRLPWKRLPWTPKRVIKYKTARDIIATKHHL